MDYTTLGKTGLQVSVMGLGAGGHSRLGMSTKKSEQEAISILQESVRLGINLIDTAEAYGTEELIGQALRELNRQELILSSKYSLYKDKSLKRPEEVEKSLDQSLAKLDTDVIDIYHVHGVPTAEYTYVEEYLIPELIKMREKGKIRFLGITEPFASDPNHQMLAQAVENPMWDVMMVGYNLLNQSAARSIFPKAIEHSIGILGMFAVRRALSRPEVLVELISQLCQDGYLDASELDLNDPFAFLVHQDGGNSIVDAAYRFCRYEEGMGSVLMGTGNMKHLHDNVASILRKPLPAQDVAKVKSLFAKVEHVTGN